MSTPLNEHCPLCGKLNNCCYGKDKSLGICWCSQEAFPHGIFELVSEEDIRVKCICKKCLDQYKKRHSSSGMLTGSVDGEKNAENNVNNNQINIDSDNKLACNMTSKNAQFY